MHLDVVDLKSFYGKRLGQIVSRQIGQRIRRRWPTAANDRVLGIGYTPPYLPLLPDAERRLAFMPAAQGVVAWPQDAPNAAALVREDMLPLEGGSIDRVLAVHCLEHADNAAELLREVWRVLVPNGRLLIVVPNRTGMWARLERTPFGHGRPFSRSQLAGLLRETMFTPSSWGTALAMPPIRSSLILRSGNSWERIGTRLWSGFAGVLIVESTKLVQQRVERVSRERERATRPVLSPALAPTAGLRRRAQD